MARTFGYLGPAGTYTEEACLLYDPTAELPSDKGRRLVFYCHSEMCGAAGDAARVARDAGYRDIWVMAPGIRGWADAGRPVNPAPGAES